ncbi:hypothetical protein [Hoeflea sp.]|uniref:hypothetical protein n=1 Tax=Hoeflea sp. TaxID=1940281 RepID=UPI0019A7E915|nr:hypothetical protein [Hoeflea sp.]MBC7282603.1 hypothetical protein [Hoeflea sp.]
MNAPATIGDNHPPDPIDDALAPFGDALLESENWLDGSPVENEGQMKAVDALIKAMKAARKAVSEAEESETKPLYDAWKQAKARYAPTLTDLDRIVKGLVSIVDGFKRKLAAEKAEAARKAQEEMWRKAREAEEASRKANAGDLEAQRNAAALQEAFDAAEEAAREAANDTVKGMRKATRYEVTDHRALLHWIAKNARDDVTAFIDEWARKNHKAHPDADGLRVWTEKESF